jgi:transcription elongation factor GreB
LAVLAVHLEAAEVIPPVVGAVDRVQFGTVVVGRAEDGRRRSWAIVGIDEVGAEPDRVSWLSPVARALHGAEVGDTVTIRTPRGEETWEIESIVGLGS